MMNKSIVSIIISILILSIAACNQDNNINDDIVFVAGESTKFSDKEINAALNTVKNEFDIDGADLKTIWYDEKKSNDEVEKYLGTGKGSENEIEPENIIVILSTFDVDSLGGEGSLEPNATYDDWQFVLIRDSKTSDWKIDDSGY